MLDIKSSADYLSRTGTFTNFSMLFADASYKTTSTWTSPSGAQGPSGYGGNTLSAMAKSPLEAHTHLRQPVTEICCWQYFTRLDQLTLTGSEPDPEIVHSEYTFGYCKPMKIGTRFYAHVHLDHMEVMGKIIIRGWLKIPRIPTCILLRATSYEVDSFRSTSYAFQMCVPRICYLHTQRRYRYYYYEWYLPEDMVGGMNWDIYFFGPSNLKWD